MKYLEEFEAGSYRNQGDFKSFIPSTVNDTWVWHSPIVNTLLSEASKELGGLNSYSELIPNIDIYIYMHIQVEANKSNRIEGTHTSVEEDMMSPEDLLPEKRDDVMEVNNYVRAMNYGIERISKDDFPFSSRLIRELHAILLNGVRGTHKTPGEFRLSQNFIGGSMPSNAVYVPPAVCDLNDAMNDFDKFMNNLDGMPTLIRLAIMHYQFETIHPFLDGNGRMGRLMIPLFLLSRKELSKPCFYISDYFEKHRIEYYDALQRVRLNNDLIGWICFFLRASIDTAKTAKEKFRAALKQVQKYNDYLAAKKTTPETLKKIIQCMYVKPVASVAVLAEQTELTVQTINKAVKILASDGILVELTGNSRNRIFSLDDYIRVFND
jgi:Fic family protein